jgi:hypothetical protein
VRTRRVKNPGRDARMHLKSSLLPQEWRAVISLDKLMLPCHAARHMAVLSDMTSLKFFTFRPFFELTATHCAPRPTVNGRGVMQPQSRIGEHCLASALGFACMNCLSFADFVKHPNARTSCDWLLPNTNHCPRIGSIVLP